MRFQYLFVIVLFFFATTHADNSPNFKDGSLTIPSVDSIDAPSLYQDLIIQLTETGELLLVEAETGTEMTEIDTVQLTVTETSPVQVFLNISGEFSNGCPAVGQIGIQLSGKSFNIVVYYDPDTLVNPLEVTCGAVIVPFSETIPLPVYGLDAGVYQYTVNTNFSGEFTLEVDNSL